MFEPNKLSLESENTSQSPNDGSVANHAEHVTFQELNQESKPLNPKSKKKLFIIATGILILLVAGVLFSINLGYDGILSILTGGASRKTTAQKAIDYLNQNILQAGQIATMGNVSEESGVIKVVVSISGNTYDSYITKDGKLFFPQAYNITATTSQNDQPTGQVDTNQVNIEGDPFVGKADAPVVMAYWFDYQCPFCQKMDQEVVVGLVKEYADLGKLKIVFKDYQFLGPDSITASLVAHAVWETSPNKFFEWHKAIFDKQDDENGGWGKKSDILALTQSLGIDSVKVDQLMTQKAAEYQKEMDDDKAEGTKLGIEGTPGTIVGSQRIDGAQPYATFKLAIDEALSSK